VLSPTEAATRQRGRDLQRVMRAAAAMQGIYSDEGIAEAVGAHRNTVAGWWKGATPEPENLRRFASATGLSVGELRAFVYDGADPPVLDWTSSAALEGARRDRLSQDGASHDTPDGPPSRRPRSSA